MHDALLDRRQDFYDGENARKEKQSDRDNNQTAELDNNCTANLNHLRTLIASNDSRKFSDLARLSRCRKKWRNQILSGLMSERSTRNLQSDNPMNRLGKILISPLLTDRPTRSQQDPIEACISALLSVKVFVSFHARFLSTRGNQSSCDGKQRRAERLFEAIRLRIVKLDGIKS